MSHDKGNREGNLSHFTSSAIAPTVCSMGTVGSALTNSRIRPARDPHGSASPMCIVQVNVVDSKFLERLVYGLLDISGRTVDYFPRR